MRHLTWVGVVAGLSLLVASCGGDDGASAEPAATDPTTTATAGETADADATAPPSVEDSSDQSTESVPQRIISLSPTHTEMLYAIGAGDQVIAVDGFSNHPPEAAEKMTELSGFEPNVEAIASYEPDLVITEGTNPDLVEQLTNLAIPTWAGPAVATFDEVYEQIADLGVVTGHPDAAASVVAGMRAEIAEITASLPEVDGPLTYYHELDPTHFTITSDTFIGYVYAQLGLRSIADDAGGSGGQYPQLNVEFILASDPDLIFQACTKYCNESAATMAARPGWDQLSAVRNGLVLEMDDDMASRWGPRIVDYYRSVAEAVAQAVRAASSPVG